MRSSCSVAARYRVADIRIEGVKSTTRQFVKDVPFKQNLGPLVCIASSVRRISFGEGDCPNFIDAAAELFRHRRQHVLRQRGASSLEDRGGRRTNRKNFSMGRNRGSLDGVDAALRKIRGLDLVRLISASARPRAVPII